MLERFKIQEWVDEQVFNLLGESAWKLFDIRLKMTIDTLSRETGWTIIVNTWSFPNWQKYGPKKWSDRGLRSLLSTTGAKDGAHPRGQALDFDCYDKMGVMVKADNVRRYILDNISKFPYLRCLEVDISWVHADVMEESDNREKRKGINEKTILLYSPKTGSKVISRNAL